MLKEDTVLTIANNISLNTIFVNYGRNALEIIRAIKSGDIKIDPSLPDKFLGKFGGMQGISNILNNECNLYDLITKDVYRYHIIADFISCFNNTILFRDFVNHKGRRISMINPRIKGIYLDNMRFNHIKISDYIRYNLIENNSSNFSSRGVSKTWSPGYDTTLRTSENVLVGGSPFSKKVKTSDIKYILSSSLFYDSKEKKIVKLDISKFYESVTSKKFLESGALDTLLFNDGNKVSWFRYFDKSFDKNSFDVHINPDSLNSICNQTCAILAEDNSNFYDAYGSLKDLGYADRIVNIADIAYCNRMVNTFMLSFLMHNNRIPTGAAYSQDLANLYLSKFDSDVADYLRNTGIKSFYFRYLDDLNIGIFDYGDFKPFNIARSIEELLNKYGLYLKYSKTVISDVSENSKSFTSALGYSYKSYGNYIEQRLNSSYRKEVLDIMKDGNYKDLNPSQKGKIAYALTAKESCCDIICHYNYNRKKDLYNNGKLKFIDYKTGAVYKPIFPEGMHIKDVFQSMSPSRCGINNDHYRPLKIRRRLHNDLNYNMKRSLIANFLLGNEIPNVKGIMFSDKRRLVGDSSNITMAISPMGRGHVEFVVSNNLWENIRFEPSILEKGDFVFGQRRWVTETPAGIGLTPGNPDSIDTITHEVIDESVDMDFI